MTDLREQVARIIAPARFEGNNAAFPTGQESAFAKADAILALVREQNDPFLRDIRDRLVEHGDLPAHPRLKRIDAELGEKMGDD
jgi:hypothetical protein